VTFTGVSCRFPLVNSETERVASTTGLNPPKGLLPISTNWWVVQRNNEDVLSQSPEGYPADFHLPDWRFLILDK
jgi:hypothetical protein